MLNRKPLVVAVIALAFGTGGTAAAGPHGGEIEIDSFSWGSVNPGRLAPPLTPVEDSRLENRSTGRQAAMTLQSQELLLFSIPPRPNPPPPASQRFLDVPPSNPFHASSGGRPGKFEDITTVLGTGMDSGRGSAGITDWGKVQEIRGAPAARPAKPAPPAAPTLRR